MNPAGQSGQQWLAKNARVYWHYQPAYQNIKGSTVPAIVVTLSKTMAVIQVPRYVCGHWQLVRRRAKLTDLTQRTEPSIELREYAA